MPKLSNWIITSIVIAIPAFIIGRSIEYHYLYQPSILLIKTLYIVLSLIDASVLGIGVAFMLYGNKLLKNRGLTHKKSRDIVYYSICWLLLSWWPHEYLHIVIGMNPQGLLIIEYTFHLTLLLAGGLIGYTLYTLKQA